jgi:ribosomal protein S18 acetylase RimI-like enzyme
LDGEEIQGDATETVARLEQQHRQREKRQKTVDAIRLAQKSDLASIYDFDAVTQQDQHRRDFIAHSVSRRDCYVALEDRVRGYAVIDYSFFDNGFVSMLYVQPDYRRRGVASGLMQHLEGICRTAKLFTSTNFSNLPMQSLLAKLDYRLSGIIYNLDEGDPELVYIKYLTRE